jgi:hypothetical protein
MNQISKALTPDIFYRAVSTEELMSIRQVGKLVLKGGELFITQDLAWVQRYARASRAGRYDYILRIATQPSTVSWLFSIGKRHQGSRPAHDEFPLLPPLTKGEQNAVHIKVQKGVITYGLRPGTITDFNQRVQNMTIVKELR